MDFLINEIKLIKIVTSVILLNTKSYTLINLEIFKMSLFSFSPCVLCRFSKRNIYVGKGRN